jgi:hypothetical protein
MARETAMFGTLVIVAAVVIFVAIIAVRVSYERELEKRPTVEELNPDGYVQIGEHAIYVREQFCTVDMTPDRDQQDVVADMTSCLRLGFRK